MLFIFLNRNRSDLKIDQPDGLCAGHFDKFCTGCCFFPAGNVRCPAAISTPDMHTFNTKNFISNFIISFPASHES